MAVKSIDEVIEQLENIIQDSIETNSALGYFAVLYKKVTIRVKEKLGTGYFEDDSRMENLDIVFANYYLQAYNQFKNGEYCSKSWLATFKASEESNLVVIQHLLLGMNAHINYDLGIAAHDIAPHNILEVKGDFYKINALLAELLDEVQYDLTKVWRWLKYPLKLAGKLDNVFVNFSMKIARNGAWMFALELALCKDDHRNIANKRDQSIAELASRIINSKGLIRIILWFIKRSEKGDASSLIQKIRKENHT